MQFFHLIDALAKTEQAQQLGLTDEVIFNKIKGAFSVESEADFSDEQLENIVNKLDEEGIDFIVSLVEGN